MTTKRTRNIKNHTRKKIKQNDKSKELRLICKNSCGDISLNLSGFIFSASV